MPSDTDMYTEPGHAALRRLMRDNPKWALNRLVAEHAEVERLRWMQTEMVRDVLDRDVPNSMGDWLVDIARRCEAAHK